MMVAFRAELYTMMHRTSTYVVALLVLIGFSLFLNGNYSSGYNVLKRDYSYYESSVEDAKQAGVQYYDETVIKSMLDKAEVLNKGNALNNAALVFLGIALLLLPVYGAIVIGGDYSNSEIERKCVEYDRKQIIIAKITALVTLIFVVTSLAMIIGCLLSYYYYGENKDILDKVYTLSKGETLDFDIRPALVCFISIVLYSLVAFVIAYYLKSSVAGIVASMLLVYCETYIHNAFMPTWLMSRLIGWATRSYEHAFAEFLIPNDMAAFSVPISAALMVLYAIICIGLSLAKKK